MEAESKKRERSYVAAAIIGFILVIVVNYFWPNVIPFSTFQFWEVRGSVLDWLASSWLVFAWGTFATVVFTIVSWKEPPVPHPPAHIFGVGLLVSVIAGVLEEICFRWLIFLSAIVSLKVINFLFFGFLGFGIAENLYSYILIPIANVTTFGYLEAFLFHPAGWAVGAAIVSANALFRDGHRYQGLVGTVNSWFLGMLFFWVMFKYGLLASIVVHFAYDAMLLCCWAPLIAFIKQRRR